MRMGAVFDFEEDDEPEALWPQRLDWFRERIERAMHGSDEILAASRPVSDGITQAPGLYFLIWDDLICYVGQANDIYRRVAAHVKEKVAIDRVAVVAGIPKWAQSEFEHAYIRAFDPPWNAERKRCGQLDDLSELIAAANALDRSCVMPHYVASVGPRSEESFYPGWKLQMLGRVQSMGYRGLAF